MGIALPARIQRNQVEKDIGVTGRMSVNSYVGKIGYFKAWSDQPKAVAHFGGLVSVVKVIGMFGQKIRGALCPTTFLAW